MRGVSLNKYDCIVVGNDIYALTVALFLARKMRKVLVVQDDKKTDYGYDKVTITDPENRKYHFEYNKSSIITGLDETGLLHEYFDDLGIADSIKAKKLEYDLIVNRDNSIRRRFLSFEQTRVYLIRYYPKFRNQIYKFFNDLNKHYINFVKQYMSMLKNKDYTLTSLMIQWGDFSLKELLDKYFSSDELKQEFILNSEINGLDLENINSYNFFSNYFMGLKSGFYYMSTTPKDLYDILVSKLKIIYPNCIQNIKVKKFEFEGENIKSIIDKNGKEYFAKYFFVSDNPIDFYSKYFLDIDEDLEIISKYYPNTKSNFRYNTLYLAINQKLKNADINGPVYYFNNEISSSTKIIKMINYSQLEDFDQRKSFGEICIDFAYDDSIGASKNEVLQRFYEVFPKVKKSVVGVKEGTPRQYLSMLSDVTVRKNPSINDRIDIESIEHIQVFNNLFVGGEFMRPEAGLFGVFNQSIMFGDKIEDRLYYGEDDDTYYYLSNEEIMMMLRHNYNYEHLGNKEYHINFHIGKNDYFIRTKGKNIVIHQGKYYHADLDIYTTNDKLSNLLLKKTTFDDVLQNNSLKFRGDKDLLFQTVKAFNLDDYQEYNPEDYIKSKYKYLGVKFLFAYFTIYGVACFLSNFINAIYIFPAAFVLILSLTILRYKVFDEINWFEYFLNGVLLIFSIMAIFWTKFNTFKSDDPFLGVMSFVLLLSVFINRPVVYNFHKFDFNIDYRNSLLFKVINNGLTFLWGFIFLAILGGTYITGERYVSALYFMLFFGIFLTYYYPVIYIRTNIKK